MRLPGTLHGLGHVVGGYDLTPSPLLAELEREGIAVTHSDQPAGHAVVGPRGASWRHDRGLDPAVPKDLPLFRHFEERGITPVKRAALLGQLTADHPTLAVAGTHGKTTTSSWLAAMLDASEDGCHAFLGGIDANTGTNLVTRGATWHVVEADEFDRSFHHLHPTCAAITNVEADHLDIYGTEEAFRAAFLTFGGKSKTPSFCPSDLEWPTSGAPSQGPQLERFVVVHHGDPIPDHVAHVAVPLPTGERPLLPQGPLGSSETEPSFDAVPALPGRHNVANALVASAWRCMPVWRLPSWPRWLLNLAGCAANGRPFGHSRGRVHRRLRAPSHRARSLAGRGARTLAKTRSNAHFSAPFVLSNA